MKKANRKNQVVRNNQRSGVWCVGWVYKGIKKPKRLTS